MALDYSRYTYSEVVTQLTNMLKNLDTWKDTYQSSTGTTLIELFAAVIDMLNYYVERRAEESYLKTAKLRSSIVNLVSLLNYLPRRPISATGNIKFILSSPNSYNVYIPKFTSLKTNDGVYYLTSEEGVIYAGSIEVTLVGIQGQLLTETFIADGTEDYEYTVQESSIENSNFYVYVDGVLWTQVDSFLPYESTDTVYRIEIGIDEKVIVIFGNNKFGKAPDSGSTVEIKYIKSDGLSGNIYTTGVSMTVQDTIVNTNGDAVSVSAVTTTEFSGGQDEETAEEIRYYAPKVFATGDRAVTKADYESLVEEYSSVVSAVAWGEFEEGAPDFTMYNVVKLSMILENWALPDATFKSNLEDYLYNYKTITTKIVFVDAEIYHVIPVVEIYVNKLYSLSAVESTVADIIDGYFELDRNTLGKSARISDIMADIDNTEGVDYAHFYLDIKEIIGTGDGSTTTFSYTLNLEPVKKLSVKVYQNSTLVGQDDGAGNITGSALSSGSINYTTGALSVTFNSAPDSGDVIYVRYQQDSDGDVEVGRNQALRVTIKEITTIYTS